MWCKRCGQDVPGIPSLEDGKFSCPRCAESLAGYASDIAIDKPAASTPDSARGGTPAWIECLRGPSTSNAKAAEPQQPVLPIYDAWELDEDLRHIARLIHEPSGSGKAETPDRTFRLDAAHAGPTPSHERPARRAAKLPRPTPREGGRLAAFLTWTALSIGLLAFVCGGSLLGWSLATGRPELWALGTPIALAGQIVLLLGLILQLDRLWTDNRRAAAKLDTVDEQLHELKTATSLLGTTHGPSATFYAHWADGASPQLLLSDLKGQLDMLAVKLGKD